MKKKDAILANFDFMPKPFWKNIPKKSWQELNKNSKILTFKKNDVIYNVGDPPLGLYIIKKGHVKTSVIDNIGHEQIIYFLGKDEIFGYRPLVCNEVSPLKVSALEDCKVIFIDKLTFKSILSKSMELNAEFLSIMGQEFRIFTNKLMMFARKPVHERVALSLLIINIKQNSAKGAEQSLVYSREDLANYVGTVIETLIRQLKLLKDKQAIAIKGRKITLIDFDILYEKANITNM